MKSFSDFDWEAVEKKLRRGSLQWWRDHKDKIVGLGKDEILDIAKALRKGKRYEAQLEIAVRMTPEEWRAYKNQTTEQLRSIAQKRAMLFEALGKIGWFIARVLGQALLSYLIS